MHMKKFFLAAAAALALFAGPASAVLICDGCTYVPGDPATYLGAHDPGTFDNSTFTNGTTGQNGNFSNTWVFDISPAGNATLDVIFLPIRNISNFAVSLFDVASATCGAAGSGCSALTLGGLEATGTTGPSYVSLLDFLPLAAGTYALQVTGTISGLVAGQPASYAGNLQTVAAVPEPETYALFGMGLALVGFLNRRKKGGVAA
jgi:hypothetical protein